MEGREAVERFALEGEEGKEAGILVGMVAWAFRAGVHRGKEA